MSALRRNARKDSDLCRKIGNVHRLSSSGRAVSVDAAYLHHPLMLSRGCQEMLTDSSSPESPQNNGVQNGAQNWEQNGVRFSEGEARRRHQPPWRSVSETSVRKSKQRSHRPEPQARAAFSEKGRWRRMRQRVGKENATAGQARISSHKKTAFQLCWGPFIVEIRACWASASPFNPGQLR